jgi:uncharacterized membrane protein (DUF2068 family)
MKSAVDTFPAKGSQNPPVILRQERSVRFLKLIAIFKILQGILLVALGFSLFFLNSRTTWMDQISDWADEELLLHHSRAVLYLLNKLQDVLAEGQLRVTGLLAFFYSAILFTEGFGVYFQKRWAEFLMVFATGALIPLEVRHILHRPSATAIAILVVNCFIVWFLYRILRRDDVRRHLPAPREVARVV